MKSIKQQYIDLKEGKMNQAQFMRNIRMSMPQFITNITSFNDTVKILKNKGIISEGIYDDRGEELTRLDQIAQSAIDFDDAIVQLEDFGVDPKFAIQIASQYHKDPTADAADAGPYGEINEVKLTAEQVNQSELRMGIRTEMEHTDDPKKAEKIALDHLSENPFYYTALKLSGVENPSVKVKVKVAVKKKDETCLVDKANQMKPVKGFEKAKASANKAKKETVKAEPINLMSLIASSVRGVQKMSPTGEKIKVIKLKEGEDIEEELPQDRAFFRDVKPDADKYQIKKDDKGRIMQATNEEGETFSVNDVAIAVDNGQEVKILGFEESQGKVKARYDSFARPIDIDGLQQKPKDNKVDLGGSFDKMKDKLKEIIRKTMKEGDGRDNMNDMTSDEDRGEGIKIGDKLKHRSSGAEMTVVTVNGNNLTTKITSIGNLKIGKVGDINKTNALLVGKTYDLI